MSELFSKIKSRVGKIDRVFRGKDSVLQSFINKRKSADSKFIKSLKQKVLEIRILRLNKRLNKLDKSLKEGSGLPIVDSYFSRRKARLEEKKREIENSFVFKPIKKLLEFDSAIDKTLKGEVEYEDMPVVAKVGIGALAVGGILSSMDFGGITGGSTKIVPFSQPSFNLNYTGDVNWTSYTTEVSGIKYQRKTAGAAVNNVVNLRPSRKSTYKGQVGVKEFFRGKQSIGYFAVFSDPYYSIRAFANTIVAYRDSDTFGWARKKVGTTKGSLTIYQMLCIAAPPEDLNNPNNYAISVFKYSEGKVKPTDQLKIDTDKEQFKYLIRAMARVENGALIDLDYLDKVWEAIYGNGMEPTQENLKNWVSNKEEEDIEVSIRKAFFSYTNRIEGSNNVQASVADSANVQLP